MKKYRKGLSLLLSVAMAGAIFSGCGNKTGEIAKSNLVLNGDEIYPISSETVLDYWVEAGSAWSTQYENFGDTPLGKELEKRTGVKIHYIHPQAGQKSEQFQLMLASDELPDLVQADWGAYSGGPEQVIADEYIYDLTDIIPKWSPAILKVWNENAEWKKQATTDSGKMYAYPFIRGDERLNTSSGPIIRKDWLNELGMEIPETIDEWEQALRAFKEKCGASRPLTGKESKYIFMTAYGLGRDFFVDNNKVKYSFYEDSYKDFLTTYSKWYKEGLIDPDVEIIDNQKIDAGVLNNEIGATHAWAGSGLGKYLNAKATTSGMDPDFDLAATKFPVLKKGDRPEFGLASNPVDMAYSTSISKNCKDVELAARFLDFGYTEAGNILLNFGIEGESFTWQEKDGKQYPTYTDKMLHDPNGRSITEMLGCYTQAPYNGTMVQRVEYIEQYYQLPQQKDALVCWSDSNMPAHRMPNVTISPEESDLYNEKYATIKTYADEMFIKFMTGVEPIDRFDAYRAQLESFGVKEVIQMKQNAYDKYAAR